MAEICTYSKLVIFNIDRLHGEHPSGEVYSLRDVAEQLVVEALDPEGVTALFAFLMYYATRIV